MWMIIENSWLCKILVRCQVNLSSCLQLPAWSLFNSISPARLWSLHTQSSHFISIKIGLNSTSIYLNLIQSHLLGSGQYTLDGSINHHILFQLKSISILFQFISTSIQSGSVCSGHSTLDGSIKH